MIYNSVCIELVLNTGINLYNFSYKYVYRKVRIYMKNTDLIYKLWVQDELVPRSIHIDDDLYERLKFLDTKVFDGGISKIVNVAIEYSLCEESGTVKYYKKPDGVHSLYRSLLIRKRLYDKLLKIKEETGISLSRLLNYCIKKFLDDFDSQIKSIYNELTHN